MENTIRKAFDNALESDKEFINALQKDVRSNAVALGIEEFNWKITESDLDKKIVSYFASYEQYDEQSCVVWHHRTWQQNYDAVGPHTYYGSAKISIRLRHPAKLFDEFSSLCFGSYYRRIAEFYPDYTTRYIDSPKEVI